MLDDLLKRACAGQVVSEEYIPPPVVTSAGKKSVEPQPALSTPSPLSEELAVPPPVPIRPPPVPPLVLRGLVADSQNTSKFTFPAEQISENMGVCEMALL
jgi:hypothetical protein